MDKLGVFQAALGIVEPWRVVEATFDAEQGRLDVRVDFAKGRAVRVPGG